MPTDTQVAAELSALDVYRDAIVLDAAAPVLHDEWRYYEAGGVTAVLATVATFQDVADTVAAISAWYRRVEANTDRLMLAENVTDIDAAKQSGKLAVVFHFQNGRPLGYDTAMVDVYRRLGVGVIQLTYNVRNQLGDGCLEPSDAGLSQLGVAMVRAMNRSGIVVDVAHTGIRTTLEAIEASEHPVIVTHANSRAVHDHPRNITDQQAVAIADSDGVIGLCAFPAFITSSTERPTVGHLLEHLDHFVDLVGIDHIGLGIDYYDGHDHQSLVDSGAWDSRLYPPPPWHYPIDGGNISDIALGMAERGYAPDDIRKVLGSNFLRVFRQVWPK